MHKSSVGVIRALSLLAYIWLVLGSWILGRILVVREVGPGIGSILVRIAWGVVAGWKVLGGRNSMCWCVALRALGFDHALLRDLDLGETLATMGAFQQAKAQLSSLDVYMLASGEVLAHQSSRMGYRMVPMIDAIASRALILGQQDRS